MAWTPAQRIALKQRLKDRAARKLLARHMIDNEGDDALDFGRVLDQGATMKQIIDVMADMVIACANFGDGGEEPDDNPPLPALRLPKP